jgi:hypothetical protein
MTPTVVTVMQQSDAASYQSLPIVIPSAARGLLFASQTYFVN